MNATNDKKDITNIELAYEADDGPLTDEFMEFLRKKVAERGPKGMLINEVSLFDIDSDKIRKD